MTHEDTAFHAPINVDSNEHRDGRWACSQPGAAEQPAKLRYWPVLVAVALPFLIALVVWLVRASLKS